jgi:hypothetical protein
MAIGEISICEDLRVLVSWCDSTRSDTENKLNIIRRLVYEDGKFTYSRRKLQ